MQKGSETDKWQSREKLHSEVSVARVVCATQERESERRGARRRARRLSCLAIGKTLAIFATTPLSLYRAGRPAWQITASIILP